MRNRSAMRPVHGWCEVKGDSRKTVAFPTDWAARVRYCALMGNYRFYELDLDGHIRRAAEMEAESDEAAVRQAQEVCRKSGCARYELWQGARMVLSGRAE